MVMWSVIRTGNTTKRKAGILMTKNGKRKVLIGTVSAACIAMMCVIGLQFIGSDGITIRSHDTSGADKVGVKISTTAPITAEEESTVTSAPADSADTTRPPEDNSTDNEIVITAVTSAADDRNSVITDALAVTTAVYTTKSKVVVDQSFKEATKPVTEPPAPEVSDTAMLTNAETEPSYEAEQTVITTTAPKIDTPQHGQTSGGMIYINGFGWIINEGGGGEGSTNEDMYCNGNKIGYFG